MKKTYIIPETKMIVLTENVALLNDSLRYGDDITNGQNVSGDSNRRTTIWDNED